MTFGDYPERVNDGYEKEDCVQNNSDEVLDVAIVGVENTHEKSEAEAEDAGQCKHYWQKQSRGTDIAY